ncbi:MAG: heme exporter protein CcmB [Deltaproteobacteria bacterium]|nr:heme exporter protein CcmB [Deltaproteobacteria bacterium]
MKSLLRQALAILEKDLLIEYRDKSRFVSVFLFGLLLLLLFSFALSVQPDLMRKMAAGLFWLTILFSSLLALEHSFQREMEEGQWEGLLLLGTDPRGLYLGKMLANLFFVFFLQLALLLPMAVLYDIQLSPALVTILFLGSLGISSLGTFYAILTTHFRGGQLLLPLLLFPMLIPLLLAVVKVTELTLAHDLFGQQVAWLKLLTLFDIVFLLVSLLTIETLLDQ